VAQHVDPGWRADHRDACHGRAGDREIADAMGLKNIGPGRHHHHHHCHHHACLASRATPRKLAGVASKRPGRLLDASARKSFRSAWTRCVGACRLSSSLGATLVRGRRGKGCEDADPGTRPAACESDF